MNNFNIHQYNQTNLNIKKAKKDVAQIFNNLLRRQVGTRYPTVDYLARNEDILFSLQLG
jgi:calcium binding protein 39